MSYEAQLQENWLGLNESDNWLTEVCMPNHHIMEYLKLYTAERGVVREISTKKIVSVNIRIGRLKGLAMRKEYLLKYLAHSGYDLVFYSLGEKLVRAKDSYQNIGKFYDLSAAYSYENESLEEIQPMRISQTLSK